MTNRIFTMLATSFVCSVVFICFDFEGGRYLQQLGMFWAGSVFGALLVGGIDDEKH